MPVFNPNDVSSFNAEDRAPRPAFFKIAPGERKIVRFVNLDDTTAWSYDYAHDISRLPSLASSDQKWRFVKAKCLGQGCPFCEANQQKSGKQGKTTQAIVAMIEYDPISGQAIPKVWPRTSTFYQNLYAVAADYSPLSNYLFIISRNGSGLDTTYSIVPAPAERYSAAQYPLNIELFKGLDLNPESYLLNLTVEEANGVITQGILTRGVAPQAPAIQTNNFAGYTPAQPAYANVPAQTAAAVPPVIQPASVPPVAQPAFAAPEQSIPQAAPAQPNLPSWLDVPDGSPAEVPFV